MNKTVKPPTTAFAHPYMANTGAAVKAAMLADIGVDTIAELFEQIPADHRLKTPLTTPDGIRSEVELRRHLVALPNPSTQLFHA